MGLNGSVVRTVELMRVGKGLYVKRDCMPCMALYDVRLHMVVVGVELLCDPRRRLSRSGIWCGNKPTTYQKRKEKKTHTQDAHDILARVHEELERVLMRLARLPPLLGDLVKDHVQLPARDGLPGVAEGRQPGEDYAGGAHVALDLLEQAQRPVQQLRGLGDLGGADGAHGQLVHDVVDVVEGVKDARLPAAVRLDDGIKGCRGVGGEQPEVPDKVLLLHQLRDCPAEPLAELAGRAGLVLPSDFGRRGEHDGISVPARGLLISTRLARGLV